MGVLLRLAAIAAVYFFLLALSNIIWLRLSSRRPRSRNSGKVSVLIPARNEERNIGRCLQSLLDQTYQDYEILVLDDQSTDRTWPIISRFAQDHRDRIQAVRGKPLPEARWNGKAHAMHQLAGLARRGIPAVHRRGHRAFLREHLLGGHQPGMAPRRLHFRLHRPGAGFLRRGAARPDHVPHDRDHHADMADPGDPHAVSLLRRRAGGDVPQKGLRVHRRLRFGFRGNQRRHPHRPPDAQSRVPDDLPGHPEARALPHVPWLSRGVRRADQEHQRFPQSQDPLARFWLPSPACSSFCCHTVCCCPICGSITL